MAALVSVGFKRKEKKNFTHLPKLQVLISPLYNDDIPQKMAQMTVNLDFKKSGTNALWTIKKVKQNKLLLQSAVFIHTCMYETGITKPVCVTFSLLDQAVDRTPRFS